jgi:hypothetical protein
MRLGGIYALEGVMNASEQYHRPVLETLCAFVRDNTKAQVKSDHPPETEIQAALTVVGRRRLSETDVVDLTDAQIPKAYLSGAHLLKAHLLRTNLNGADLSGADLRKAGLRDADLSVADLSGATISTQFQLDHACGTEAKLPPGLTLKPCGPPK